MPVNQGRVRLTATAGIRIGAIVPVCVCDSVIAPCSSDTALLMNVFTGPQRLPALVPWAAFDQTTVLPSKVRLVASSNS